MRLFADVTTVSTLSETQYNYASFLSATGRPAEAREWAQRVLSKKLDDAVVPASTRAPVVPQGAGVAQAAPGCENMS